ncbi:putative oxalocrotonate tautomerase [Hyaloscypha variabilis]
MPLLQFYTNVNQLTQAEKEELAKTLTDRYATRMPAFFVDIVFNELPHGSFFAGGKPADGKFVRFTADHIAINWGKDDDQRAKSYLEWLGGVFKERFEPKGWTWEFHVTASNVNWWRIQSLIPPPVGSEALKTWVEAGKAIPWEGMEKL